MEDLEKTTRFFRAAKAETGSTMTVFDGPAEPRTVDFDTYGKDFLYFGRNSQNDIVLTSPLVSSFHGRIRHDGKSWILEDKGAYEESGSTNGLIYNDRTITSHSISDGDFIRIDDGIETVSEGVLFVFSAAGSQNRWISTVIGDKSELKIGRDPSCDLVIPHISASKHHATLTRSEEGFFLTDNGSTNGVIVNNTRVDAKIKLHEKDVISVGNTKIIFTQKALFSCCYQNGISVDATDIVIKRGKKRKSFVTCNHVDLSIKPGELVAVIGGSGAGKSTILNCMCGYLKPSEGEVYINGIDLYKNFDSLKKMVGYVPQSDIVYDNLSLYDMLKYTVKLRLPADTSPLEQEAAISRAISLVELTEKKNSLIKSLSGGQRKRASIAVELLSDPKLLFLDEPASGLDPGTERNLMMSLRKMADSGKTVVLVTHSTLQLKICDKIVFMGKGGNLCFCGGYEDALAFFGKTDIVDIYNLITDQAREWSEKFRKSRGETGKVRTTGVGKTKEKKSRVRQLSVLISRYMKLIANDRQRLLLLLAQAPLLAVLISFVSDGEQFVQYEMTKSLLFALSCSAFWVGMLNAIQEICKERTVLKREYMTGLSLTSYIASKIIVLGILCLIQSLMITVTFSALIGLPSNGLLMPPFLEVLVTTFITAVVSAAMGLFVSSLFSNPDRAMTVAPILLMPQILFSGLIFQLSGATKILSWFAICRWSMEAFGSTTDLNRLSLKLQQMGFPVVHEVETFYENTAGHLLLDWGIMIGTAIVFLTLSRIFLSKIKDSQS